MGGASPGGELRATPGAERYGRSPWGGALLAEPLGGALWAEPLGRRVNYGRSLQGGGLRTERAEGYGRSLWG